MDSNQDFCSYTIPKVYMWQSEIHPVTNLCHKLCIAKQNRSIGVNVASKGSPSRMRRVLLISLGMTILPKSSTLLTMPVAFIYLSPFLRCFQICASLRGRLRPWQSASAAAAGGAVLCTAKKTDSHNQCAHRSRNDGGRMIPRPYKIFTNYDASICKQRRFIRKKSFGICVGDRLPGNRLISRQP